MKTINCSFDFCELYKEAEGGWEGWYHPVWANIVDDEIELSLGDQVSINTIFFEGDIHVTPKSWVGSILTWNRTWGPDDAEKWAEESICFDPEDYDPEEAFSNEVLSLYCAGRFDEDIEDIKNNIIEFAKSEGYDDVEFY